MTNLDSLLKSRDITLPTKVHVVKTMVFPAVMYGCESWTIKKAESRRIDASELWCWGRFLRAPWIARRSNKSILKEISPEYSLEGLMLDLKLQYFGHLMWRANSFEKKPDAGREWRQEEKGTTEDEMVGWHCWLDGHEFEHAPGVGDGQGNLACCSPWGHKESDMTDSLNWTDCVLLGMSPLCCMFVMHEYLWPWKQHVRHLYYYDALFTDEGIKAHRGSDSCLSSFSW